MSPSERSETSESKEKISRMGEKLGGKVVQGWYSELQLAS